MFRGKIFFSTLLPAVMLFLSAAITGQEIDEEILTSSLQNRNDVQSPPSIALEYIRQIGDYDSKDDKYRFYYIRDVDFDAEGNIYVLDSKDFCIKKYDKNGRFLRNIGRRGQGPGEFQRPIAMALDSHNDIYVLDFALRKVQRFDSSGKELKRFSVVRAISSVDAFRIDNNDHLIIGDILPGPFEITVEGTTHTYELYTPFVCKYDNRGTKLQIFDVPYKKYKDNFNTLGFNKYYLTIDNDENVFVAFLYQNLFKKYQPNGQELFSIEQERNYDESKEFIILHEDEKDYSKGNYTKINRFTFGLETDSKGRIWILSPEDQRPDEDVMKNGPYTLEFELFDKNGNLLCLIPFDRPLYRMIFRINGSRLYVADNGNQQCIYEYKIIEKSN